MQIKSLSIFLMAIVTMVSACASSVDKWQTDASDTAANPDSGWQQNQQSTNAQKRSSGSYWTEENRY